MSDLPPSLLRTITSDHGTEMARHTEITADLGVPIYFCDPHAPWQRGSNENTNGAGCGWCHPEPCCAGPLNSPPARAQSFTRRAVRNSSTSAPVVVASCGSLSSRRRPVNRGKRIASPCSGISSFQPAV
jgi:hypothetical protein